MTYLHRKRHLRAEIDGVPAPACGVGHRYIVTAIPSDVTCERRGCRAAERRPVNEPTMPLLAWERPASRPRDAYAALLETVRRVDAETAERLGAAIDDAYALGVRHGAALRDE